MTISVIDPIGRAVERTTRILFQPFDLTKWLTLEVKDIMGAAAEEIDFDNLDPTMAFLEIGLDSLLVTELQRRIQEKLDFRFEPMQGLDYQSIESLAKYILDEVLNLAIDSDAAGGSE